MRLSCPPDRAAAVRRLLAALAWGAAAVHAAGDARGWRGPDGAVVACCGLCALLALWRLREALIVWLRSRDEAGYPRRAVRQAWLARRVARRPRRVFVGVGCRWGARETIALAHAERTINAAGVPARCRASLLRWAGGASGKVELPLADATGNWLVVGAPGTGKSALFALLASQAIHRGDVVVVVDPKGSATLEAALRDASAVAGRDFFSLLPGRPAASVRFDPLANWQRPAEIATRITRLLRPSERSDPFVDFAWMALHRMAGALVYLGRRPTLALLRNALRDGGEALLAEVALRLAAANGTAVARARSDCLAAYRQYVRTHPAIPAVEGLIALVSHDRQHYAKMILAVMPLLDMMTAGALEGLLSPSEAGVDDPRPLLDSGRLMRQRGVLYAALESLGDPQVTRAIGGILLSDLAAAAGERYRYGESQPRVSVFVDEAGEVVNAPFVQLLNKGREAGFACCFAVQTLADLEVAAGGSAAAAMLIGNANGFVALRTQDIATQRYAADKFGKVRLSRADVARAVHEDPFARPGEFTRAFTRRDTDEEIDAVPSDLLGRLPDLHGVAMAPRGELHLVRIPTIERLAHSRRRSAA